MNNQFIAGVSPTSSQKGAVLIVGLIMVLLMTIVGLAAIRGSGLQEAMAGNMRDRNIAFQAAEAGLREGEDYLEDHLSTLSFDGTTTGLYRNLSDPGNNSEPVDQWSSSDWSSATAITSGLTLQPMGASEPLYLIEKLDVVLAAGADGGAIDYASQLEAEEVEFFRLTSRGLGLSTNSQAIVQSTYKP